VKSSSEKESVKTKQIALSDWLWHYFIGTLSQKNILNEQYAFLHRGIAQTSQSQ
jgi:hypothetical protein